MNQDRQARKPNLVPAARRLRREQTPAETTLWNRLRGDQLGHSFRRQHVIGRFVVDFCCPTARLNVEVDGEIHDVPEIREQDEWRAGQLQELGYMVLRLPNELVLSNEEAAITLILEALKRADS